MQCKNNGYIGKDGLQISTLELKSSIAQNTLRSYSDEQAPH